MCSSSWPVRVGVLCPSIRALAGVTSSPLAADGITFADGRIARPSIALAEVQGYCYAAYRARAAFARQAGDEPRARHRDGKVARLKRAFNQAFWLPAQGWFAVALDRGKRPVDALTSNIGHCLWTGIADAGKAAIIADRLRPHTVISPAA